MPNSEPLSLSSITRNACVLDSGCGVNSNGTATGASAGASGRRSKSIPLRGVWHDGADLLRAPVIMLFDGVEWDCFSSGTAIHVSRASVPRHGNWKAGGFNPNAGHANYWDDSTGICNVLFLDGHA